jgi:hypothetical protein
VTSAALVRGHVDVGGDVGLQELWLATQRRAWRSLAVVSASAGLPTIDSANKLAQLAWRYNGESTCVFDLFDVSLRIVEHQLREIHEQVLAGHRVFVALRSVAENPAALPIARATDALVLCVALGKTDVKSAQRTIGAIGRERFLGSILVGGGSADGLAGRRPG